MYSNILVIEKKQILNNILTCNSIDSEAKSEMLNWYEVITKQNYFMNKENIILQEDGLALGAPIFRYHFRTVPTILRANKTPTHSSKLPHIAQKLKLVNYFCYVDDILIIFDSQHTDINTIAKEFNTLHPKVQFSEETEKHNKINYLDITIHRKHTHVNISIFRKPTYTDTLIPYTSNHPVQHKHAAIRFL